MMTLTTMEFTSMENKKSHDTPKISYEQFFEKYYHRFADYCTVRSPGEDAEDIVMDAFTALWRHWDELDSHAEAVLCSWIKKAIALLSKAHYRKRATEPAFVELDKPVDEGYPLELQDTSPPVEDRVVENETYKQYLAEINKRLSPADRELFDCMVMREMSIRETAKALSKSEKAISVGMTRLRTKLRDRILPEILSKQSLQ